MLVIMNALNLYVNNSKSNATTIWNNHKTLQKTFQQLHNIELHQQFTHNFVDN